MVEQYRDPTGGSSASVDEHVELIEPHGAPEGDEEPISEPAKVMRIGSMIRTFSMKYAKRLDKPAVTAWEIYEQSVTGCLGPCS